MSAPTLNAGRFAEALELLGEEMPDAIDEFRNLALQDIAALHRAYETNNHAAASAAAHRLAGASMTLGASRLSAQAESLEAAGKAGGPIDPDELQAMAVEVATVHRSMLAALAARDAGSAG
ncbi:MAG: hypothetical protein JWM31_982 [Solirubrobacterales bacterium]|nr:hypothetical protein [Solirubrobacterales bacterium]